MAVPSNITTAQSALSYIQSNSNLSVNDIKQLALQMNTKVAGDVKTVLLYSGGIGIDDLSGNLHATQAWELAEFEGAKSPSTAKVATIGQTQAASLLNDPAYKQAFNLATAKNLGLDYSNLNDRVIIDNAVSKAFYGESAADGTRTTMGLWDQKSVDFINSNVTSTTPVKTISPLAENKGTFSQAEVEAVKNSPAPSVDNISKADTNGIYNRSYNDARTAGLSDSEAKLKAQGDLRDAIKAKSFEHTVDMEYARDAATGKITAVDTGSHFYDGVSTPPPRTPIADNVPGKSSVSKSMGDIINDNDYKQLSNGADSLAKQAGFGGYEADPRTSSSIDTTVGAGKVGSKLLSSAGIIGDVLGITLAAAAANKAWAAGDEDSAAYIIGSEVAGIVGGAVVGGAAIALAAAALPVAGVGAVTGFLIAGLAGGLVGDLAARAGFDAILGQLANLGLVPEGGIDGLLNDYAWMLDNVGSLLGDILPDWLLPAAEEFDEAPNMPSPLVLDLDGDGVEVTALGFGEMRSNIYFDIDNDGFAERTAWVTGGDGLLAIDRNSNGKIDNKTELFGDNSGYADGFANLKPLDSNSDNRITSADTQWSKLRVWVDANENGITDAGELKTMSQLNITSISLSVAAQTGLYRNENLVSHMSTFTQNGQTRAIEDVWFRMDDRDTQYQTDTALNIETLFLPTLKGFGNLKDLHVAMSEDATLLNMVKDFTIGWSNTKLANPTAMNAEIDAILYKWAGVEGISTGLYGNNVNAKSLGFMEKITGFDYSDSIVRGLGEQGQFAINNSYKTAFTALKSQLIVQASGGLFGSTSNYDLAKGDLSSGVLSAQNVAKLSADAAMLSTSVQKLDYWKSITESLLQVKAQGSFTSEETSLLNNAVSTSVSGATWTNIASAITASVGSLTITGTDLSDYLHGTVNADNISGGGGNDTIMGGGGNDSLLGGSGNDTIIGGDGNNVLHGGDGDDILKGEKGNDNLQGGNGNDTYIYNVGDGTDTITDSSGLDIIQLGAGFSRSDLLFQQVGNNLKFFSISTDSTLFTIQNYFSLSNSVRQIRFSDNSIFQIADAALSINGTSASQTIKGSEQNNDIIYGLGGDDFLEGQGGNDILIGGTGRDYLEGNLGDDTYVFTVGDSSISNPDVISKFLGQGSDTIKLIGNILPSAVKYWYEGGYWHFQYSQTDKILIQTIQPENGYVTNQNMIHKVVFDNGTVWDFSQVGLTINDTNASNSLVGTNLNDLINGNGGNDYLYGGEGNDTLTGGTGMDRLNGDAGDDVYIFAVGDSAMATPDVIYEWAGEGVDIIRLSGVLPQNVYLWNEQSSGDTWQLRYSATDEVLIQGSMIEKIVFDNGTVWDMTTGYKFNDTNDSHILLGSALNDSIAGNGGNDEVYGYAGNDQLSGNAGDDFLDGDAGSDILDGGTGMDDIWGDRWAPVGGDDTYIFRVGDSVISRPDTINEIIGGGTDTIRLTGGILPSQISIIKQDYYYILRYSPTDEIILNTYERNGDALRGVSTAVAFERVQFDNGTILNLADLLPVVYTATSGNDTINASAAPDSVVINLLAGNDVFTGSNFSDNVSGGDGNDTIEGRGGNDVLNGGAGTDTVSYVSAASAVTVSLAKTGAQNTIGAGTDSLLQFENLTGSAYNDTLSGSTGANRIDGGAGNDTVEGGAGNDVLIGGAGTDTVSYATSAAAVTVNLATTAAQNTVGAGTDTITLFENILGSAYNDTLTGDAAANRIDGGAGNDTINGGAGNDVLIGGAGTDTLSYASASAAVTVNLSTTTAQATGGSGSDTISLFENLTGSGYNDILRGTTGVNVINGGNGNDTLYGNSGNDTLYGGAGNDTLYGDAGNDILLGEAGTDTLYGGTGADTFKFRTGGGVDTIKDFKLSELDKLDIKDLLSGYTSSKAITDFIQITTSGTNSIVKIDANGTTGGVAWTQIATIEGVTGLTDELALKNSGAIVV